MPSTWAAWRMALSLGWRVWPTGVVLKGATTTLTGLLRGPVEAVALERLVRDVTRDVPPSPFWVVVLVASVAALAPVRRLWNWIEERFAIQAIAAAEELIVGAALRPIGIRHLEDPGYSDTLQIAQERAASVVMLHNWLLAVVSGLLAAGVSACLLAAVHPFLLLPLAVAAGLAPLHAAVRRNALALIDKTLPGQRLAQHLFHMGRQPEVLREVQLMGLSPWLIARHRAERLRVISTMKQAEIRPVMAASAAGALQALALGGGLTFVVALASRGEIGPGQVAAAAVLLSSALAQVSELGSAGSDVARNSHAARHLARLVQYVDPEAQDGPPHRPVPATLVGSNGISLQDVSFTYSWASDREALSGVSLELPPGSVVALVGENGAGKSTLVKLLLGLYQPTSGSIQVAGIDLRHLAPDQWRSRATGAFQDFARFRFLARESIGVGRVEAIEQVNEVRRSAQLAGVAAAIELLPQQFETQLGKMFEGGAELSEGQWQRIALARSEMRSGCLLSVLDEPTSALDPLAEEDVFRRYAEQSAANRAIGAVTVLVSHRFSTVALADRIVVLDDGRVLEEGSHAELMTAGGRYAELYELQATRYR